MKKFYIYINEEQIGPLTTEELVDRKITRKTKVWYDSLDEWKNADEIEDLKEVLKSIPPPINSFSNNLIPPKVEIDNSNDDNNESSFFSMQKKKIVKILLLIVGVVVLINLYNSHQDEQYLIDLQLRQNQREIQNQKSRVSQQEQIEVQRKNDERVAKLRVQFDEYSKSLNFLRSELYDAEVELIDATSFKLLRSSSERHEQISLAQNGIDQIKDNIKTVEQELAKIGNQLGYK